MGKKEIKLLSISRNRSDKLKRLLVWAVCSPVALGVSSFCKPCHSSLHGRQQAQPCSVVRLWLNTQLISAPYRLQRGIWSAWRAQPYTNGGTPVCVCMDNCTIYMQMTDLCTHCLKHEQRIIQRIPDTLVGVMFSQPTSRVCSLLTGGGWCCSHSCFSGIHPQPYHNEDPILGPQAPVACFCLPLMPIWGPEEVFLFFFASLFDRMSRIQSAFLTKLLREEWFKHIHSWGDFPLTEHSCASEQWSITSLSEDLVYDWTAKF